MHAILGEVAFLYRKYNLGNKEEFLQRLYKLDNINRFDRRNIWDKSTSKVKHDDIIKDSMDLNAGDLDVCKQKIQICLNAPNALQKILHDGFDPKRISINS